MMRTRSRRSSHFLDSGRGISKWFAAPAPVPRQLRDHLIERVGDDSRRAGALQRWDQLALLALFQDDFHRDPAGVREAAYGRALFRRQERDDLREPVLR